METQNINTLLDSLSEQSSSIVELVNNKFYNLDTSILNKKSLSGGWSILECLDHLNSYGKYYLPEIENVISKNMTNNSAEFKSGWLGNYFTKKMLPSPNAGKMKSPKPHLPASNLKSEWVLKEFLEQQKTLLQFIEKARSQNLNLRLPISLSKMIRLKLGDVFQFIVAHNERHIAQALRNI